MSSPAVVDLRQGVQMLTRTLDEIDRTAAGVAVAVAAACGLGDAGQAGQVPDHAVKAQIHPRFDELGADAHKGLAVAEPPGDLGQNVVPVLLAEIGGETEQGTARRHQGRQGVKEPVYRAFGVENHQDNPLDHIYYKLLSHGHIRCG